MGSKLGNVSGSLMALQVSLGKDIGPHPPNRNYSPGIDFCYIRGMLGEGMEELILRAGSIQDMPTTTPSLPLPKCGPVKIAVL